MRNLLKDLLSVLQRGGLTTIEWFRENGIPGEVTFEKMETVSTYTSIGFFGGGGYYTTRYKIIASGTNPVTGEQQLFTRDCKEEDGKLLSPGNILMVYVN